MRDSARIRPDAGRVYAGAARTGSLLLEAAAGTGSLPLAARAGGRWPPYVLLGCILAALPARAAGAAETPPEPLARFVPADVGLYLEGRQISDLLLPLSDPQAWLMLAELSGQRARLDEVAEWQTRIQQTIQMPPAEALQLLLSQDFAYLAEAPGRAQDAVVLCRPAAGIPALLERWQAQPLPTAGRSSVYRLPNRIGLALPDGLLMFGDEGLRDGMFQRVLRFADSSRKGSLADDPVFRSLLARVPADPDAVLFARLAGPTATAPGQTATRPTSEPATEPASAPAAHRPAGELPGPLRGASNVLLALHRRDRLLRFSAVGDGSGNGGHHSGAVRGLVQQLPERTLLAWGAELDYPDLLRRVQALPERSLARAILRIQENTGTLQPFAEALGSASCLAIGTVPPRAEGAPPLPAVAILIDTHEPQRVARELDSLVQSTAASYNLLVALQRGGPVLGPVATVPLGREVAWQLDLSELLAPYPRAAAIAELHVCWTVDGSTLILASHLDWLRRIAAARHGAEPTLAACLATHGDAAAPATGTLITVQAGPIADLGRLWLDYLARTAADVLDEGWWRQRQPGGGDVRLGIQVTELPDRSRLRVSSIAEHAAAAGVLKPGDEIVGCNGRRFSTSQPVREVREEIARRPNARWVDLELERGGTAVVGRVPLPFVDPVQVLRRAIATGQIVQRLVYQDDVPDAGGGRGVLTIELRRSQEPLFEYPGSQPVRAVGSSGDSPR